MDVARKKAGRWLIEPKGDGDAGGRKGAAPGTGDGDGGGMAIVRGSGPTEDADADADAAVSAARGELAVGGESCGSGDGEMLSRDMLMLCDRVNMAGGGGPPVVCVSARARIADTRVDGWNEDEGTFLVRERLKNW